MVKSMNSEARLALKQTRCVTLSKLFDLSGSQCTHLQHAVITMLLVLLILIIRIP